MSLETTKDKIIKNNEQISELLRKNEELLREDGFDLPNENFVVGDWYKIKIPSGYIRNTTYFYEKYHLDSIVKEWQVKANIAYSFQLSDFYNYLFNRFNIWGSVVIIFYKNAIINLVSIFEALVLECANNICERPSECKKVNDCRLLKEGTVELLRQETIASLGVDNSLTCVQGDEYGYGLGVRVRKKTTEWGLPIGEFGWDGAAGTYIMVDPINKISVVIGMHLRGWPNVFRGEHLRLVQCV